MKRKKLSLEELQRATIEEYKSQVKHPVIVVLDNIRSALNVGSIFRSADAFALERIILTGITPHPPHKEITKTAIGATESVEWQYINDRVSELNKLKSEGYRIISIEQTDDSIPLREYPFNAHGKYVLLLGNEVSGVSEELIELCDDCIEIKQFGTKHSLNVSVCSGIVFWAIINQFLH